MTATASRITPSIEDKADLIRRHFPALMPWVNAKTGDIDCPSMRDHNAKPHIIERHEMPDGSRELRCDCEAGKHDRPCTHVALALDLIQRRDQVITIHKHVGMSDAEFQTRFGRLMKSTQPVGGLA